MPTSPDSYAAVYLREVGEIVRSIDPAAVDALANALADVRRPPGPALRPRRRRRRGPRLARRQRLPEALRLRGVCADRQRRRDHGANERRGVGDELRRVAPDLAPLVARRDPRVLGRRREPRAQRLGEPRPRDRAGARGRRTASSASSARADGATAEEADVCIVVEAPPERRTPHVEEFQAIVWHLLVSHPALVHGAGEVGVGRGRGQRVSGPRRLPRPRRRRSSSSSGTPWTGRSKARTVEEDVRLVPGAADAIRRIRSLDYRVVVVSNQPGAAKGKASREDLRAAHERVVRLLAEQGVAVDDYRYCLHHPDAIDLVSGEHCDCRKPKPGMLLERRRRRSTSTSRAAG